MPRWLVMILLGLLGLAAGLYYAREVAPVDYVDTTPDSLREDYRADYVLMVAESFHAERNEESARRKLAVLGTGSAETTCGEALQFGRSAGYSAEDVALLEELQRGLQAGSPSATPDAIGP